MITSRTITNGRLSYVGGFLIGLFVFGLCVKLSWLGREINFRANQAAFDAFYYHVPQINEFIVNGFSAHYHNFVAMIPGLHLAYAALATVLGHGEFYYQSGTLFAAHSLWMVAYLMLNFAIIQAVCRRNPDSLLLAIPLLASSYPAFSWIWPTTDLPATVLYMIAILLEFQTWQSNTWRLVAYAGLGAVGVLIRQHYAFLAAIPAGLIVADALLSRRMPNVSGLAISLLPVIPSVLILGYFVTIWGGPVPPDQAYHFAVLASPISFAHLLAFTGLIGAPFALSLLRLCRQQDIDLRAIVMAAAITAGLMIAFLPLNSSVPDGRFGSMVWTIENHIHIQPLRWVYLLSIIGFGAAIWYAVIALCLRRRHATPTVFIFGMYALTLLVQEFCFQRYVEQPMLLTLAVFILLQTRLPRLELTTWVTAFGCYGLISWGKLLVNLGGFGQQ